MNRLFGLLLIIFSLPAASQYQFQRLNHLRQLRTSAFLYNRDVDVHTSVQPLDLWQIDTLAGNNASWAHDLSFGYNQWLWRKIFDEHFIEAKGHNYYITIDPVVNFQLGSAAGEDDIKYVNTRGFTLQGKLGNKFSFQSSYLENQARFPFYVSDFTHYRNVVPGQGIPKTIWQNRFRLWHGFR